MITRPFDFAAQIKHPRSGIDLVPFFDVCVILLFFGMFGSRFVLAPGVAVDLRPPATAGVPRDALPTSRVLTVSEIDGRAMLMFEGRILDVAKLERFLAERAGQYQGEVLLVRMDRDVSMVLFVRVLEVAKRAGFDQILLAAEPESAADVHGKNPP